MSRFLMGGRFLMGALAAGGALALSGPASAYEGLWCLRASMGRSVSEQCHFTTFEACRDERSLWGTTAFCSQNPRYLPYWQGRGFSGEPPQKMPQKSRHRPR
jgi:hypothetical protein